MLAVGTASAIDSAALMLERFFDLRARHTDLRTEIVGGTTTFVTLSYIIFVQPAVLSTTGMDAGVRTGLASVVTAPLMHPPPLLLRRPLRLALRALDALNTRKPVAPNTAGKSNSAAA